MLLGDFIKASVQWVFIVFILNAFFITRLISVSIMTITSLTITKVISVDVSSGFCMAEKVFPKIGRAGPLSMCCPKLIVLMYYVLN